MNAFIPVNELGLLKEGKYQYNLLAMSRLGIRSRNHSAVRSSYSYIIIVSSVLCIIGITWLEGTRQHPFSLSCLPFPLFES